MGEYYEIDHGGEVYTFATLDEAIAYADDHIIPNATDPDAVTICEIGGAWDDFRRCWWCGDWYPDYDLRGTGICEYCEMAIDSREGSQWKYK